ncbi:MAG: CDP-alcohol phosphatidyltransferase family protein, partial [Candidatus Nanopelagicales bacterium]
FLLEYGRARAGAVGLADVGVVTVGERPTRIIGTAMFLLGAGLYASASAGWATAGAGFTGVVGTVAVVQLLVVLRRRLH